MKRGAAAHPGRATGVPPPIDARGTLVHGRRSRATRNAMWWNHIVMQLAQLGEIGPLAFPLAPECEEVPRSASASDAGWMRPRGVGSQPTRRKEMRSRWTVLAAAAAIGFVPLPALAGDDVEAQLRQMNERMSQMEQQLQATNEELAASKQRVEEQQTVIQNLDEDRQASSGLSRFLSETEFSGLVAASYTYNFKNFNSSSVGRNGQSTTGGENASLFGIVAPQHQNSNNFQIDQLAFRMKKTPTAESRAGWGASITWGSSADVLAGRSSTSGDATGDLPELTEAYASYLFDVMEGVNLTLGRYMTPVGAESFFMNENINVTRGLLWTLQPVNHTGGYIGGACECGLSWQLGASNGYGN